MEKFYYRFDEFSELGKQMKTFHRECLKAETAAEEYVKKMGGVSYYSSASAFAGGVACIEFDKKKTVDLQMWRLAAEADGHKYYEPRCVMVAGCDIHEDGFWPSNTKTIMYDKTVSTFNDVAPLHSLAEWADIANYKLTGDREHDEEMVTTLLKDTKFIKFIRFTGDQKPKKGYLIARGLLRAAQAERMRMKLPIVPMFRLYEILQADQTADAESEKEPLTPTFFIYKGKFYIAIDRKCHHPELDEIAAEMYVYQSNMLKLDLRLMQSQTSPS